jgi:hypothetical protein
MSLPTKTRAVLPPAPADESLAYYTALPFRGRTREISALEQMYGYYSAE